MDVRGGEDTLAVFVPEREPSVPATVLLQDLHHVSKLQPQERVGSLLGFVAIDNCGGREGGREGRKQRLGGRRDEDRALAGGNRQPGLQSH